ncbi:hypothetical protein NQ315_014293 [Exocentrus adspersus]|uniref:Uncharacterized protein n=1 Tax=Exocentrus adspersus TaxID=1586481 RepID=A0AAV8VJ00_9CUCU|nr:hypothetical protein NQ315_014293 [Exocentrus adspersus]
MTLHGTLLEILQIHGKMSFILGLFFKTTLILFSLIFVANVSILYFYTLCLPTITYFMEYPFL